MRQFLLDTTPNLLMIEDRTGYVLIGIAKRNKGNVNKQDIRVGKSTSSPIKIRGHHLLCMPGFRGLGYNERFVRNLAGIVSAVRENPDVIISLTDGCDDICSACPHIADGRCHKQTDSDEKLKNIDRAFMERLGLKTGEELTARQVYQSITGEITTKDMEHEYCLNCEWWGLGFCRETLCLLKRGEFFKHHDNN